jgi:hypothetical protein
LLNLKIRIPVVIASFAFVGGLAAFAWAAEDDDFNGFQPGNLVVSRSVYDNKASNITIGTILPPNCAATLAGCDAPSGAPDDGTYPTVWNNNQYDGSFGLTSKIVLDQLTPGGKYVSSLEVPNSSEHDITSRKDQLVTSFSSKSELALNLSTDGRYLTFMGYLAPIGAVDLSNANTPLAPDPTNPVGENVYRAVAMVDREGHFRFTKSNAYSGNNGRAAIFNNRDGANVIYTAGNAGNGANPQPTGILLGAGAQIMTPSDRTESEQTPGLPTPLASFSITLLGSKPDKVGKDDNFRGLTIFNNVIYYTKGSGGNGVNTVYFEDVTGKACPKGVGLPSSSATLPTMALVYNSAILADSGLPSNMCILAGFPSTPNSKAKVVAFPFGIWFANATTVYIADEGDGYAGGTDLYTHAAAQTTAGLQKWLFNAATQTWGLAYTLQAGLGLGAPDAIARYPTGNNTGLKVPLPWAPATDGLRNITGRVNRDGTASIWGVTSTISGNGDQGADPNKLVEVRDVLTNGDPSVAAGEKFSVVRVARYGEVLRGVSFTPGSGSRERDEREEHQRGDR